MAKPIVLFISAGRAGTQWLAWALGEAYADLAVVTHEPLKAEYDLRKFLRHPERVAGSPHAKAIHAHLDAIANDKTYIETGWTGLGLVPLFYERFGARLRLVQLYRHPVPSAISLLTHGLHDPDKDEDIAGWGQLDPGVDGVVQRDYAARWPSLTPFEKCLFQWTEIHLYGAELRRTYPKTPFLEVKSEDMFVPGTGALRRIAEFAGLPAREEFIAATSRRIDRYTRYTRQDFDPGEVRAHPRTVELALAQGYDLAAIDTASLRRRYRRNLLNALRRARRNVGRHFRK